MNGQASSDLGVKPLPFVCVNPTDTLWVAGRYFFPEWFWVKVFLSRLLSPYRQCVKST